jgi:integrase
VCRSEKQQLNDAAEREKVTTMKWEDLEGESIWHVPHDDRQKGTGGTLKLPPMAVKILQEAPRLSGNPYVFPGRDNGSHISTDSGWIKNVLMKKSDTSEWRIHDLRRTARSLMSRAGVRPEIAERVMGHVQGGVLGIYDRHHYRDEKAEALHALARLIENILRGPHDNVVKIGARA